MTIAQPHLGKHQRAFAFKCAVGLAVVSFALTGIYVYNDYLMAPQYGPVDIKFYLLVCLATLLTLAAEGMRLRARLRGICPYCEETCVAYAQAKQFKCPACFGNVCSVYDASQNQAIWSSLPGAEMRQQRKTIRSRFSIMWNRVDADPYLTLKCVAILGTPFAILFASAICKHFTS
jgi:hypothetical protein